MNTTTKTTARSRLNQKFSKDSQSVTSSRRNTKKILQPGNHQLTKLPKYIKHLPLLILSAPFYLVVSYLLLNVHPQDIANIPLYNSYLGLLVPFFLANIFSLGYLSLNLKTGFTFSLLLTILLFLKLQQFIFEYWWLIPLVISFVISAINAKLTTKTPLEKRKRG